MGSRGPVSENQTGPKPKPVRPKCPKYFDKIARAEWRRVVPELERLGRLSSIDGRALEAYCNACSIMESGMAKLNENGLTMFSEKGLTKRPEVAIVEKAMSNIKAFAVEYGLTPMARARMRTEDKPEEEDEMAQFLRGG